MCLLGEKSKVDRQEKYLSGFLNYNSETQIPEATRKVSCLEISIQVMLADYQEL